MIQPTLVLIPLSMIEETISRGTVAVWKKTTHVFLDSTNKPQSLHWGLYHMKGEKQGRQAVSTRLLCIRFLSCVPTRQRYMINEINISTLVWQDFSFNVYLVQSLTLSSGSRRFIVCGRCRSRDADVPQTERMLSGSQRLPNSLSARKRFECFQDVS